MIDFRFYLITDRQRCAPRALQAVVREACDAGVKAIHLREKDLSRDELQDYTARLLEITSERAARLIINRGSAFDSTEDIFVSASLGVDGFHFPESEPFPHELRKRFPKLIVGVSTHSSERALAASAEGADFVTFGPVFDTPSKQPYGPAQGLDALAAVCSGCGIPVIAVGGITPENAGDCIEAGAHGVAAIGAVMAARDVASAVESFRQSLGSL
jgi:thiamine-phosphate pyrophosphorylase